MCNTVFPILSWYCWCFYLTLFTFRSITFLVHRCSSCLLILITHNKCFRSTSFHLSLWLLSHIALASCSPLLPLHRLYCTVCSLVFLLNILLQFLSPLHFFIWLQRTIQWTELNNNVVDSPNGYYMKLLMILSMLMSSHFQPRSFVYRNTNRIHLRSTLVGTMFQWTHKHTQQQQLMFGSIRCCELILCVRARKKFIFHRYINVPSERA